MMHRPCGLHYRNCCHTNFATRTFKALLRLLSITILQVDRTCCNKRSAQLVKNAQRTMHTHITEKPLSQPPVVVHPGPMQTDTLFVMTPLKWCVKFVHCPQVVVYTVVLPDATRDINCTLVLVIQLSNMLAIRSCVVYIW